MDSHYDQTRDDVLREVRDALHVPEGASIVVYAKLHFARSVVACNIYNTMDSLVSSECDDEFVRKIMLRELEKFPK
jgi:hypothetical protein